MGTQVGLGGNRAQQARCLAQRLRPHCHAPTHRVCGGGSRYGPTQHLGRQRQLLGIHPTRAANCAPGKQGGYAGRFRRLAGAQTEHVRTHEYQSRAGFRAHQEIGTVERQMMHVPHRNRVTAPAPRLPRVPWPEADVGSRHARHRISLGRSRRPRRILEPCLEGLSAVHHRRRFLHRQVGLGGLANLAGRGLHHAAIEFVGEGVPSQRLRLRP